MELTFYSCLFGVLFTWILYFTFFVLDEFCNRFWNPCIYSSGFSEISPQFTPAAKKLMHQRTERQQKNTQRRKDIKQQVFAQTQEGIHPDTYGSSVRQLLCDDADCMVCGRAAQEAQAFIYSWGTKQDRLKDSRSQEPPVSCEKFSVPPCGSLVKGPDSVPRSASEPTPLFKHTLPDQKTPALSSSQLLPMDDEGKAPSTPQHGVPYDWKEGSKLSVNEDILKEDSFRSMSFTPSASSSCSNSSFSFSEISSSSLKVHTSIKHVKKYYSKVHHKTYKDSPQISSGKAITGIELKKRSSRKTQSVPEPAETSKTGSAGFRGMPISFMDKTMLASLESHMVTKRMQHLIGLPLALLRSFKKFMPSAPDSPTQKHKKKVMVVTRPQILSFMATGIRKELERHLKKMVQQKRWQLPQKVQDALKHIKPYSQSRTEKFSSAGWRHKHKDIGQIKSARRIGKPIAKQSATVAVLDSKTTPALQEKLQVHITKKSLEMRLETFHSIVRLSQKISTTKARHWLLPKLIPLGQIHPQLRNKLGLSLRKKADTVEMNVKSKCIYFLWGLPTLYMKSLSKFVPSPPSQPISFTIVHSLIEFGFTTPALMISSDANLETHVLKKRLQHQWGLPRLVFRSLREFLLPAPPSQDHLKTKSCDQYELQIFTGFSQLLFTTSEVKQKLETHLRSKIIERQWGLPKRVFESLQMFVPPGSMLIRSPKVDGKSFGREFKKGTPSTAMVSYSKKPEKHRSVQHSKGQVLQRNLAKKVLERHLSPIVPRAQQPRVAHKLPQIIPPQTCSLKPRSQQLLFVDQETLSHIKLNIIHKDLAYKWKMPTLISKSFILMIQNISPSAFIHYQPRKSAGFSFTEKDTPFVGPKAREALEWHVRKKTLHHIWGLPGLIWRSVQYLLPATPSAHPQKKLHREVIILPSEVSFLSNAIKRELERNMQKRVVYQRWLLPKRILESMKLFYSSYSYLKPMVPWQVGGMNKEQGSRLSKIEITAPPRIHARSQVEVHLKLHLHLAKKHLEIYLDALPVTVRTSWRHMLFSLRIPLPKIILSHQPMLPRRTLLPFACRKAIDRIEMTVQRNHFASLWELTTHYVKALEQLMPKPLSQSLKGQKRTAFLFTKIQWVLPPGFSMETLELHIKRKRIQHEWGFPVLIQKSIKSFIYQPPSSSSLTKTKISVHTLVQELSFLHQDICKNLELHVQKTKLYHQWGLPQRVLGSLKKLQPEVNIHAPKPKTLMHQTRRTISTYKTFPLFQTKTVLCTMCCKQRMVVIPPHVPHKLPLKGSNYLEKICLHLSKKYVEIQLEVFPDIVMDSWKHNVLATRQPLPKLISHSPKILQPRRSFLPFMQKQEAKRLEMAVQLHYFSSLWGLAKKYVEAVDAMIPRSYASPLQKKSIPIVMFSETQIPFLQPQEREFFELHIRKKRLHHEWGFPALIQSSLRVFMQGVPPSSTTHRTTINVHALLQKLSFLPWPTCNYLEFHVQKLKLQRRWGLPKRILESLKYFRPSAPLGKAQLPQSDKKTKLTEARFGAGESQRVCCKSVESTHSTPKKLDLLKEHIRRKYIQVQLETLPRLVRQSSKESSTIPPKHLPKLIEAGQKSPTNRPLSLFFLPPSNINMLEQNLRHKHLTFLWGVSKKYMESLSIVVPVRPFPARTQKASIAFLQPKTPFVQKEAREILEYHIQIKRLHRLWGLPFIIQSSLQAFTTYLSIVPHPPQRIRQEIRISVQDLPFVSKFVQQSLASSIKKMVIHSQWGLPKRLHKFLRGFRPTPPGDHEELREFRNFLVSGPKFKKAQRITRLPQASFVDGQPKKAAFLTDESADLLERHIQHKKFQHEWGLPSVLQRSLRAFAPLPPEPQRASTRLAIAAPSGLQSEVRVTTAPKLLFLDPVTKEHLEAHTKRQIARHRWGLPKQVQESMKTLLPPTYFRQPEDLTDRIPLVTHDQVYPARIKELSETRARHRPTIRKATKWRSQIEEYGGRQLPLIAGRHLKSPSPHIMNQIPTLSGKVSPKCQQESWVATFYTKEAWDTLEFHIRRKKIQHDWGLPSMVKKSLNAFAHHPPELHSTAATSGGRISIKSPRKGATHRSLAMVQATIPHLDLHFVSTEIKDSLEAHLKNWTMKHKWELPKLIRGSLRAIVPPQPESQSGMRQSRRQHSRSAQPHKIFSHHERKTSQRQVTSKKGASKISSTISHQGQSSALAKLLFLTEDNRHLLEFHIQQKKIQHAWGVPLVVLRSLNAFFPFPIKISSTGKKRLRANQWVIEEVKVVVPFTFFLSMETKEVLETHMKRRIAEHKWSIPKRVQQTLGTLSTPQPHFQSKDIYRQTPLCRRCKLLLQTTDDSQTEKEKDEDLLEQSEKDRRRKRRKKEYFQPRNQRRSSSPGRSSRQFLLFSELKLSFLSDEARNYLEFHIQQKKIQRAWSLPSTVLRSLQAFAPFSSERARHIESTRKRIVKTHGWNRQEVKVIVPNLSFLSERTKDILEAHLKRRTAEHRWGMPKAIQKLLGSFVPSRPPSQHESIHEQSCWKCKSLLGSTDVSETEKEDEDLLEESKKHRRTKRRTGQYFQPRNQRRSSSPGRSSRQFLLFSELSLPFLSDEARNYLEFHIQQKKIQRAWSLPSTVLRSLQAFAPFSSEKERRIESTRKRIVKTYGWNRQEVKVIVPNLSFLSERTKDILEAHLKRRTAEHRWGMPKAIQKLLGSFVPSRPPSQHESIHEQPSLCWKCKSFLGSTDVSEMEEEDNELWQEIKKDRRRKIWKGKDFQPRKQRESTRVGPDGRCFLVPMEGKFPLLSEEARNYLEFHIQQKKIQRAWNLPSLVLKSLRAFAPFPLEEQKDMQDPRDRRTKKILWDKRDVPIDVQSPLFLSPDVEEHLDTHVRHITTKHQWGLLERVQQPLQAFLPLRSHSPSELEEAKESSLEGSKPRKVYHKTKEMPSANGNIKTYSEVKLPFFVDPAWNLLEFHIQHKKLQHAWGLPFMVLKSIDAFAPYIHDSRKHPLARQGAMTAHKLSWDREFHMIAPNLSFLSSDTKQHLEAHLRNLIAVHRWELPKHAQATLRAFLHPGTLSSRAQSPVYKSTQISLPQTWGTDKSPMKKSQLRKKEAKLWAPRSSSTAYFRSRKVDFLDDGAQDLLEFHIVHKNIQHAWGLPALIQKSLRLFAPSESQKEPQSAADVTMKTAMGVAANKSWIVKEVKVAPQQLRFLQPDIKKQLERHIRDLTAKHRWRLPKLVQDTLVAFIPQTEQMGEEMKEPFSTYDEDLLRSSSSSGAPDTYDSELFYELHQTPMGIRASWLDTEEPSFCFDRKTQHDRTVQGKMARREAPEVSKLQKLPPQRIESDLYLKDEQIWASDLLGRTQDPRGPFFSTPVSGYQKGRYNVSSSSESLSMEKYPSQRTDWLAREREALPCSSNMSLKKDILKQLQSTSQRKEDDRYYPVGSKQSQLSKVSSSSWVPNRFCRIGNCPCLCHLPSSREGSMLSLRSVRKQRPDLTWGTVKETETDSSSLLTEDRSSLRSISAKKVDVRFSSLPSEDAISELSSGATLRNASLPGPGYQGALFQEERVFASNTDLQNVTTSGSEPANTSEPSEQLSSSTKGMFFQEAVQPSLAVEQRAVLDYRREDEQTVTELGMDELDGGKHSSIEKVEEKTPNWGKDLSTKEPFTDIRPFIEHKTTKMSGTTQKRRKPMSERGQPKKPKKPIRHTHFLVSMEPDEKMSILGRILERKLRLRHGLSIWKYSHGKMVSRIKHKIDSFRQSFRVRSRTRSKDSTRRNQSHSPESTTRSSSSSVKARSRGRSRERRSKTDVRRKELPQKEL